MGKPIRSFLARYKKHDISVHAASSAFFLMLSIFPFFILVLHLARLLPIGIASDGFTVAVLPEPVREVLAVILSDAGRNISGALISVTAVVALWSAGRGVSAIRGGLCSVFEIDDNKGYIISRILSSVYVIGFLVVISAISVVLVLGSTVSNWLKSTFPGLISIIYFIVDFRIVVGFALLVGLFLLIYKVIPAHKMRFRDEIPGAVITAVSWMIFSYGFSIYISNFSDMSTIYGSMSAIAIIMLWMYFAMIILLCGAEVNSMLTDGELTIPFGTGRG